MLRFSVFCLLGAASSLSLQASTILELDCQATVVNLTPSTPSGLATVTCPLFDGSLGTLTRADFVGEGFIDSGWITLQNNSSTQTITDLQAMTVTMQMGPVPGGSQTATSIYPIPGYPGWASQLLPGQTVTFQITKFWNGEAIIQRIGAFIASPGVSTFDLPVSISTALAGQAAAGTISVLDYSLNAWPGNQAIYYSSFVAYYYDPAPPPPPPPPPPNNPPNSPDVPEPATYTLAGIGLAGVWLYRHFTGALR